MFSKVAEPEFVRGEHEMLRFWTQHRIFEKLREKNANSAKTWSFLDGPITANNPMGVHHAWGRTYKDAFQRFFAMTGHRQRYQNGFDCQGLWVEVEVEKELKLGTKRAIESYGIDRFVNECKRRVLRFAARQTEQSIRLGYWMEWDLPEELRKLAESVGTDATVTLTTPRGQTVQGKAHELVARLGNPEWGGSYFTFSTENNETIWTFLKKCYERGKIYRGHDVMPWSGRAGSAYSQMEVADGRRLTTHRSCFVRFPILRDAATRGEALPGEPRATPQAAGVAGVERSEPPEGRAGGSQSLDPSHPAAASDAPAATSPSLAGSHSSPSTLDPQPSTLNEYLLVWTTTPWTLTSNVACAVNPDLDYVKLRSKRDGAIYYFAKDNLEYKRLDKEFKEGFGRPEWGWPQGTPKLKTLGQLFKEQGGYEIEATISGDELLGLRYLGPFDDLNRQQAAPSWCEKQTQILYRLSETVISARDNASSQIATEDVGFAAIGGLAGIVDDFVENSLKLLEQFGISLEPVPNLRRSFDLLGCESETLRRWLLCRGFTIQNQSEWLEYRTFSRLARMDHTRHLLDNLLISQALKSESLSLLVRKEGWQSFNSWKSVAANIIESLGKSLRSEFARLTCESSANAHRVIDGGRDFKGNPNVVAGEGTGIVHIAPGCGDVDHVIGRQYGLAEIAPLREDGTFDEGFGDFTGRSSIDPATAQLVFDKLKEKGFLVYVEDYPHIYPHCWRTGDELVFRLVDEWFINMDWRDEIKAVVAEANWLPDSIDGKTRETEWLTNMRDWMVSKKRFWGLALPIWINPDDPTDFDVMGSLAELKERAVEGWDGFTGNTPHRPWIDRVKIKSTKTGATLQRIPDVGNPWLDAGIVPFSTLQYNTNKDEWRKWYPPDFVTECFPGQFRNWFYSLLALSTMMRYDETDDPADKRPFKTLLGHRLVMNEEGKPMHKSDGTAIWFEEAAEQLGVDTMRWMYLAQNPSVDLRFGTRHPDQPVTLETVDGPISTTLEGLTTFKVTSKPSDEVRRQILIPLWNSYAFFVNYARLDGFDPSLPQVPVADRPEIDRWILSNLQALIQTTRKSFTEFNSPEACRAAAAFIDDLSNWYIRRNRRRFWRSRAGEGRGSRDEGQGTEAADSVPQPSWDTDKLAAYQTLYHVLVTLTKLLAPAIPFLTERMYQNLASVGRQPHESGTGDSQDHGADAPRSPHPLSVHLCDFPEVDSALLDESLNRRTSAAQLLVTLAHGLREKTGHRVRQPLAELRFACASAEQRHAIETLADVVKDELNVKQVTSRDNLDDLVHYSYKPNLKTLGPKLGKLLNLVKTKLPTVDPQTLAPLRRGEPVTLTLDGNEIALAPEDVMVSTEQASDWVAADDQGIQIALSTTLTPELIKEGNARDFIRSVQQMRKDAGLAIEDRIEISFHSDTESDAVREAIEDWRHVIQSETLGRKLEWVSIEGISSLDAVAVASPRIGETTINIRIRRA